MQEGKGAIGAAILAGGLSSRMGGNKALLRLGSGGPTIIETVVTRLAQAGLHKPLLVANRPEEYDFLGLERMPDDIAGAGALGGILTALNHSRQSRVFVVACDMPLLNVALLKHMLAIRGDYDALVPRWHDAEQVRVEPLHAIYSTGCAPTIRKQIERGRLKVSAFLDEINVAFLDEDELRRYDPDLRSFSNINTPDEWEAMREA
jgi:molybdopterin-guanine dinucleotide biosynthesis protein A